MKDAVPSKCLPSSPRTHDACNPHPTPPMLQIGLSLNESITMANMQNGAMAQQALGHAGHDDGLLPQQAQDEMERKRQQHVKLSQVEAELKELVAVTYELERRAEVGASGGEGLWCFVEGNHYGSHSLSILLSKISRCPDNVRSRSAT